MDKRWEEMTPYERDALVAEKIMGRRWNIPQFSTDMAAAWQIVEYFGNRVCLYGPDSTIMGGESHGSGVWECEITVDMKEFNTDSLFASGATAPEAICRAALLVKGVAV